jgi:hypothetical protein
LYNRRPWLQTRLVADHRLLPSTFEVDSARLEVSQFRDVVVVVYLPGSQAIQPAFFIELAAVFEVVATLREPVFITGDLNIRLDRPDDRHSVQLYDLVASYGFVISRTMPTHRRGGMLYVVISRLESSFAAPTVTLACPTTRCSSGPSTRSVRTRSRSIMLPLVHGGSWTLTTFEWPSSIRRYVDHNTSLMTLAAWPSCKTRR